MTSGSSEERKSGKTFLQLKMTVNDGVKSDDVLTGAPQLGKQAVDDARVKPVRACVRRCFNAHVSFAAPTPAPACFAAAAELTLPQFFTFMKELQAAKASLDLLS